MGKQLAILYQYRYLLYTFIARDILARYKQTFIGVGWAIIQPFFLMVVFTVIFGRFLGVSSDEVPYPVFSFVALLPWTFFNRAINTSAQSLFNFKSLITKVYFPREIAPFSMVISSLVDFIIGFVIFIFMFIFYRIPITPNILYILILLPLQIFLAAGISLIVSSLTVLLRDITFGLPLLMQIIMYASPVIYSVTNIQSKLKILFYFNPFVGIIEGYRQTILLGKPPLWNYLAISIGFSIVIFFFGYKLFKKLEPHFMDIL